MRVPVAAFALSALWFLPVPSRSAEPTIIHVAPEASAVAEEMLDHLEVELASLPVDLHRRAIGFLELERERPGSKWVGARLASRILPMTRPGELEATHYEVRVVDAEGRAIGYFVLTVPHIMAQARAYVTSRNIDIGLTAEYDGMSIMTHAGKMNVLRQIRDSDTVVAIGIGYFSHYPLAYGYEHARFAAWDADKKTWQSISDHHRFVVNMGWAKYGSSNVPFDSWFAGYLTPKPAPKASTTIQPIKPPILFTPK